MSGLQREFPDPNVQLEQYPTSFELTASVVSFASEQGDLGPGRSALDLGCGTGMLMAGCLLAGCTTVVGVDCDEHAMNVAKENVERIREEVEESDDSDGDEGDDSNGDDQNDRSPIQFIVATVKGGEKAARSSQHQHQRGRGKGRGRGGRRRGGGGRNKRDKNRNDSVANDRQQDETSGDHQKVDNTSGAVADQDGNKDIDSNHDNDDDDGVPLPDGCVDTVLTNPPFGTKHNEGIDVRFLQTATRLAKTAVYSFHKSSTRDYLLRTVREWGHEAQVVAEMRFDIPQTYKFHKQKSVDVAVDLLCVRKKSTETDGVNDRSNEAGTSREIDDVESGLQQLGIDNDELDE